MNDHVVTILSADDHALFREGLAGLINQWGEYRVIGEVENGQQALDFCRMVLPDIILMDINMPVMGGIEATKRVLKEFPSISIVMLTMAFDKRSIYEALRAGAQGYILKDIRARDLKSSLDCVLRGEPVFSGDVAKIILSEFKQYKRTISGRRFGDGGLDTLTERETQIIQLVVDGFSNIEIANQLYLSDQTIKKALSDVMQKLQLTNRVQVATYALRNGLAR
jgi:DNA-binding NarL/FixJ family response regulator